MTSLPTGDAPTLAPSVSTGTGNPPLDPAIEARIERAGLSATIAEVTAEPFARVVTHLADPMAADSRAAYAAWLRRQVSAWNEVRLPAVPLAAIDWPLTSVRPQCLDVVGLLLADLRELSPRMRPTTIPRQHLAAEIPQPGAVVASVELCVRLATPASRLLAPATALTAGLTQVGSSTRYLTRCAQIAERAEELSRDVDGWAIVAGPVQAQLAVLTARQLADRLAAALDAGVRTGW